MKKNKLLTAFLFAVFLINLLGLSAYAATYVTTLPDNVTWYSGLSSSTTYDTITLSTSSTTSIYPQAPNGKYIDSVYLTYSDGVTPDVAATVTYDGARKRYTVKFPKVSTDVKEITVVLKDTENLYLQYTNVEDTGTSENSAYRGYKIKISATLYKSSDNSIFSDSIELKAKRGATAGISVTNSGGNITVNSTSTISSDTSFSIYSTSKEYSILENALSIIVPSTLSSEIFSVTDYIEDNTTGKIEGNSYGTITINDNSRSYVYFNQNPENYRTTTKNNVENNVITELSDGKYYIRSNPYYDNTNTTYYLASKPTDVTVNKSTYETATVNFTAGKNVTYSLEKDGDSISSTTFTTIKSQSSEVYNGSVDVYYTVDSGYVLDEFIVNSASGTANIAYNDGILTISNPTTKSFYIAANTRQAGASTQISALSLSSYEDSTSGNSTLVVSGTLLSDGNGISGKTITLSGYSSSINALTDENGSFKIELSKPSAGEYAFQANFKGDDSYDKSNSDILNVSVIKPEAPQVINILGTSGNSTSDGEFEVVSSLPEEAGFEYNRTKDPDATYSGTSLLDLQEIIDKKVDDLSVGTYYVRNSAFIVGNTFYLPSASTKVVITGITHTLTLNGSGVTWFDEDGYIVDQITVRDGETKTITLELDNADYDLLPLEYDNENANIVYDSETGAITVSGLKKSISINAVAINKNTNFAIVKTSDDLTINDNTVSGNAYFSVFSRNDSANQKAVAVLVAYDRETEIFEFTQLLDVTLEGAKTDITIEVDNIVSSSDIKYAVFIWDNLNSIIPLTEAINF